MTQGGSLDPVRLPDLETIRRFSIAVRSEHADADEVIEALRMDLQRLLEMTGRMASKKKSASEPRTASTPTRPERPAPRKQPAARKPASSKAAKSRSSSRQTRRR